MNKKTHMKQGFSLIEVIVAVAILAVLSMPILLYFTNAAIHSAKGKHEQAADVAAQSIVEEIDAVTDFNTLEESLVGTNGWTYVSGEGGVEKKAANVSGVTEIQRPITIDYDGNGEKKFMARVEVDYGAYKGGFVATGETPGPSSTPGKNTTTSKFNGYNNPHLPEVYSDKNVVISESDETESGIYALYHEVRSSGVKLETVRKEAERDFELSIKKDGADKCRVRGGYRLSYDGKETHVIIKEVQVLIKDLTSIYFLFKPMEADSSKKETAKAVLNFESVADGDDFKDFYDNLAVSFVRQNTSVWASSSSATPAPNPGTDGDPSTDPADSGTGGDPSTDPADPGTGTVPAVTPAPTPFVVDINEPPKKDHFVKIEPDVTKCSGDYMKVNYFASDNVDFPGAKSAKSTTMVEGQGEDDKGNLWMVYSPNDKRIAQVRVFIYEADKYDPAVTTGELAKAFTSKSL